MALLEIWNQADVVGKGILLFAPLWLCGTAVFFLRFWPYTVAARRLRAFPRHQTPIRKLRPRERDTLCGLYPELTEQEDVFTLKGAYRGGVTHVHTGASYLHLLDGIPISIQLDGIKRFLGAEGNITEVVPTRQHAVIVALYGKYRLGRVASVSRAPGARPAQAPPPP